MGGRIASPLSGRPLGVPGEESVCKSDVISKEQTKCQAHQTGGKSQPLRKILVSSSKKPKGGCDAHGDQHHASNRSRTEDEEINHGPVRIADRRKNEQCNRR